MKYRIKNPEIEKAILGLCTSEDVFIETLNRCCEEQFDYDEWIAEMQPHIVFILNPYDSITGFCCSICIDKNDIEEVVGYDPKKWNEYPKVTPPKEGWYRVEHDYQDEVIHRALYWDGEYWLDEEMSFKHQTGWILLEKGNPRFKPWDDEEGEE